MIEIEKIDKEIKDSVTEILELNGMTEIDVDLIKKETTKQRGRGDATADGLKMSKMQLCEATLHRLTYQLSFAKKEKSP